jgi:MFS family permease
MGESGGATAPARRRFTGWLPDGRAARVLIAVSFVDALGTGLFLTGSALFFTQSLHLTPAQVGLGLSLAGVAGLLCSVPIGRLSDRVGALPVLVGLQFWRGACFLVYPFADNFALFLVVAALAGTGEWAAPPVVQSLVGRLAAGPSRVRTMSALMVARNVAFTLGATAAGTMIAVGGATAYVALVLADAVSFFLSGALLVRLRASVPAKPEEKNETPEAKPKPGLRYLTLALLNGVLYLHAIVLTVGLPLWIVSSTAAPDAVIGVVVALNTVLAVVLQVRLGRNVDGARAGGTRQGRAGAALALSCLLVAATSGLDAPGYAIAVILVATVALTVGEVYQAVGAWAVSYALSPDVGRGYFLSVFNLGQTGAMIIGPSLLTTAVLPAGRTGWTVLAAALALAGAAATVLARRGDARS